RFSRDWSSDVCSSDLVQGGIVDHRHRCQALFERRGVDEWLETGARLPPRLGDMVELVFLEIKATNQGPDRAVARVQGNKCSLHQIGRASCRERVQVSV